MSPTTSGCYVHLSPAPERPGPSAGATRFGTWVIPGPLDFCHEQFFFDRSGTLTRKISCCEGDCSEWGLGLSFEGGPPTRDLCEETLSGLRLRGARLLPYEVEELAASDGGFSPVKAQTWSVPFGTFTAQLARDGGEVSFSLALGSDGGLAVSSRTGGWAGKCDALDCTLREGTGAHHISLSRWFELADGGTGLPPPRPPKTLEDIGY